MVRLRIKWQVVLCVAGTQIVVLIVAGAFLLGNARTAIQVEIDSSWEAARSLVLATAMSLAESEPHAIMPAISERLVQPRHVRLQVFDVTLGRLPVQEALSVAQGDSAPGWFAALVRPEIEEVRIPVVDNGQSHGWISMTMAPEDEITEIWQDARDLLLVAAAWFAGCFALLALVVGRALRPLARLDAGLRALQAGHAGIRIPEAHGPDLGPLVARLNTLSARLQANERERDALMRKVVEVSDAERKTIAMELHDEFGPCLFGLKVKARAIEIAAGRSGDTSLVDDAGSILAIVDQIQTANRRLLTTLRPMAIGQLPLLEALRDMIGNLQDRHRTIEWLVEFPPDVPATSETIDLTVFRFFQEGVTNALRHAEPSRIRLGLSVHRGPRTEFRLSVEDNGRGMQRGNAAGRGLVAMGDRLVAVGGRLSIMAGSDGGTLLAARLPVATERAPELEARVS